MAETRDEAIRRMHAKGLNVRQIARALDADRSEISTRFLVLGLRQPKARELAPEELVEMTERLVAGETVASIAADMRINRALLVRQRRLLGLSRSARGA